MAFVREDADLQLFTARILAYEEKQLPVDGIWFISSLQYLPDVCRTDTVSSRRPSHMKFAEIH